MDFYDRFKTSWEHPKDANLWIPFVSFKHVLRTFLQNFKNIEQLIF